MQEGRYRTSGGDTGHGLFERTSEVVREKTAQGSDLDTMAAGEVVDSGAGVLGAIGETIVEIAQHTTELVAGPGPQAGQVRDTGERRQS